MPSKFYISDRKGKLHVISACESPTFNLHTNIITTVPFLSKVNNSVTDLNIYSFVVTAASI